MDKRKVTISFGNIGEGARLRRSHFTI